MNFDMILAFVILGITIILFVSDKLRVDIVAIVALLALVLAGLIDTEQALAGFANSTVIMIAALFIVGGGLFRTGVADWLGDRLLALAGSSELRLLVVLMIGVAGLSAFLSNTGTVAVLLPAVVAAAWRIRSLPSRLLLPMAFAAQIGGLLTLIGTPPNIVIVNTLLEAGLPSFGFFEFSLIGLPLLVVGTLYMLIWGRRWLPEREVRNYGLEQAFSPAELAEAYHMEENLCRLRVRAASQLIGQTLAESRLRQEFGITVIRIERPDNKSVTRGTSPQQHALRTITETFGLDDPAPDLLRPGPEMTIQRNDILLVECSPENIPAVVSRYQLGLQSAQTKQGHPEADLLGREVGLAEIVLTPRSALIGHSIIDAHFAEKYDVQVLGVSRRGRPIEDQTPAEVKLTFGDALLVRGTWRAIGVMENEARNFVVVGRPASLAGPTGLSPQALIALAALAGMLALMVSGVVSTVVAVLLTALVMVLGGCLNMEQAYRAINWESVVLIAAMLPMSTALQVTGGAEFIANGLITTVGALHPLFLMATIFLLTAIFTQVISNTATTVLIAPIAIQAALNAGISPQPMMMMVAVGASTAFLTPIASPVNTLVLTPGGYHFGDFMKVGVPLLLIFMVVSLILVPLIWGL